jgi:hypothetical protein
LVTVAVKFCPWPVCTAAVAGETLTEMAGGAGLGGGPELLPPPHPERNTRAETKAEAKTRADRAAHGRRGGVTENSPIVTHKGHFVDKGFSRTGKG